MKTKLCCVFNTPSLYRELIYSRIENCYDCEWYFETTDNMLETFDASRFRQVKYLKARHFRGFYIVRGLVSLLWQKKHSMYLMMGHSRNVSTLLFLFLKKCFFPSKKVYLWTHGYYGKETKLELMVKRTLVKMAEGVFVYGNYSRNLMIRDGISEQRLFTIHNSLNYDKQLEIRKTIKQSPIFTNHFGNSNPTLIFIGRLNEVKRLDMLVNALSALCDKGMLFNLVLVGDGPMRKSLESLVDVLHLTNQVWFWGACYDEATNAELIYNADLCVAPGNVGLTAIHTLMFGCPVLTHNNFAYQMPEFEAIQEGKTGSFFKHDDVDSLASAILNWFGENKERRNEVRQACFDEIDATWNPDYQMTMFKSVLK